MSRSIRQIVRLSGLAAALLLAGGPARPADGRIAVIVASGALPSGGLSLDELGLIYRRKKQFLGSVRVQPINLPAQHPLRRSFSQQVLQKTPEDLEDYWRDQYFNGISPPFVLASEEAMIRFVAATPGAVGYVSQCLADKRVTVVTTIDGGPACSK